MKLSKKSSIKIPKNIKVFYYNHQNYLLFIGPTGKKILKLKLKLVLQSENNIIYVTKIPTKSLSGNRKKTLSSLRGTISAKIKQILLEVSVVLSIKMKLIGVGYKLFSVDSYNKSLLQFKLGFSHPIYYRIPKKIKIVPVKAIFIYIFGNSYVTVNQIAANIRKYKLPEPYKGKGILYATEKILLKEGKKV